MAPPISTLPVEVLFLIASKLGPSRGLASLCRVNKDMNAILELEMYKLDVKERGNEGLVKAAWDGELRRAEMYLEAGADINAAVPNESSNLPGFEPVTAAVWQCRVGMIKFLAERGANLNQVDADGTTPLSQAIDAIGSWNGIKKGLDTIRALLEGGANVNLSTFRPEMPENRVSYLQAAMEKLDMDPEALLVPLLIEFGVDVNQVFSNGLTALQYAACEAYYWDVMCKASDEFRLVRTLVQAGADVTARTEDGKTALDLYEEKVGPQAPHWNPDFDPGIVALLRGESDADGKQSK